MAWLTSLWNQQDDDSFVSFRKSRKEEKTGHTKRARRKTRRDERATLRYNGTYHQSFSITQEKQKKRAVSVTPTPNTDIQRNKGYPSFMFYRCNQSGRYWNQGRSFINSYSNITEHGFYNAKSDGTQQGRHKINTDLAVPGRFPVVNSAFHNAFNQLAQLGLLNLHTYLTW